MNPGRDHVRLTGDGPPRFTPADRLEALDRLAKAARALMTGSAHSAHDASTMVSEQSDYLALEAEVVKLDEIERFLGIAIRNEPRGGT